MCHQQRFSFLLQVVYMGVVLYAPALALNAGKTTQFQGSRAQALPQETMSSWNKKDSPIAHQRWGEGQSGLAVAVWTNAGWCRMKCNCRSLS